MISNPLNDFVLNVQQTFLLLCFFLFLLCIGYMVW